MIKPIREHKKMSEQQETALSLDNEVFIQCANYIEKILFQYQTIIGADYQGYLNHCKRVAVCCLILAQDDCQQTRDKIAIAVAFHDIGIWTAKTIDYIQPSVQQMRQYLEINQLSDWQNELTLMITEHHKLTATECDQYPLVEHFRKADYADFSLGLLRSNIPFQTFKYLTQQYPNCGFHKNLMFLGFKRFLHKPWSPLPMFKW